MKGALLLRNPHSVLETLRTRPRDVLEIQLSARASLTDDWREVVTQAESRRIPVRSHPAPTSRGAGGEQGREGGREGGQGAWVRPRAEVTLDDLIGRADATSRGVWLAFDELQDPHNVGALFRTAAFFGVRGIVLTEERTSPMSATVYDVASGGVEHVPFARPGNLQRTFEVFKERGFWILGASEHADSEVSALKLDRPWLVVLGNEERGLRRLTLERCDVVCAIRPAGVGVGSLNVSVAGGVILSHLAGPHARGPT